MCVRMCVRKMQGCRAAERVADWRRQHPAQSSVSQQDAHDAECDAAPWESIVEEGFQATLAGSDNGKVYGAGIYFAKDSALAHKYAVHSARRLQSGVRSRAGTGGEQGNGEEEPLRVFLSRIVAGVYTGTALLL